MNFFSRWLEQHRGKVRYRNALLGYVAEGRALSASQQAVLQDIARKHEFSPLDVRSLHRRACRRLFKVISADDRITNEEIRAFETLCSQLDVRIEKGGFNQLVFNRMHTLAEIDAGRLPVAKIAGLPIVLKRDEEFHWVGSACIRRCKTETTRISYAGTSASLRIVKGVRYHAGSVRVARHTEEHLLTEDVGHLWFSNQRVGFQGRRKTFSLPYNKILSFDLTNAGLRIAKDGREQPFLIGMDDYDVPCAILSLILSRVADG
jgi:hypothetical protein